MDEQKITPEEIIKLMNDKPETDGMGDMTLVFAILMLMLAIPRNNSDTELAELKGRVDVIEKLVTK